MNESFGQKATVATIGGAKETLVFGTRYDVRYGTDDAVLRGVLLGERAPNGDLLFYRTDVTASSSPTDSRYRVRPSTIDSLVESSDVVDVPNGETATAYIARLEVVLGGAYSRWIATDEGQRVLGLAADEDRRSRNGKASRKAAPEKVASIIETILPGVRATSRTFVGEEAEDLDPKILARNLKAIADSTDVSEFFVPAPDDVAALIIEEGKDRAETRAAKGRPYAERNQVWRCGSCKRRTRAPFCENGHPRVEAPAGKRRDDR